MIYIQKQFVQDKAGFLNEQFMNCFAIFTKFLGKNKFDKTKFLKTTQCHFQTIITLRLELLTSDRGA